MRCHAKAMAGGERDPADDVGMAEGALENQLAVMQNRQHTAGLVGVTHLVVEPQRAVVERRLQPICHGVSVSALPNDVNMLRGRVPEGRITQNGVGHRWRPCRTANSSPPYSSGGKGRMALFKGNNRKRGCAPRLFHRWDLMLEAGAGGFGTG